MKLEKIIKWGCRAKLLRNTEYSPDIAPERKSNLIKYYEDLLEKTKHYKGKGNIASLMLCIQRKFPNHRIWIYDRYGEAIMCGPRHVMGMNDFVELVKKKASEAYHAIAGEGDAMRELEVKINKIILGIK